MTFSTKSCYETHFCCFAECRYTKCRGAPLKDGARTLEMTCPSLIYFSATVCVCVCVYVCVCVCVCVCM